MIVTGNMRAWREVIEKRNSPAADQEIRELAEQLLAMLRSVAPNTFQDM
jgi:thymidylate synthase (FAD)